MNAEQRRDPRFAVRKNQTIQATLRTDGQTESNQNGRVIDISRRGAKLEVDGNIPTEGDTCFQLECDDVNWQIELPGVIHWRQPRRQDGWWVGCSFKSEIDEEALERLAAAGVIDRRGDSRQPINRNVQVKLELNDGFADARLIDLSTGGFKVWLPKSVGLGERIVLVSNEDFDDFQTVGRTCWVKPTGDGFFVGCSFVQRDGYGNLLHALGIADEYDSIPRSIGRTAVQTLSLAAGVAAVLFGVHGLLNH